ncbi:MAG: tetratricopeptide repeat protein [Candidatus Omnitrophica bacterium]|nr:tetratricopeptide repeat protein [Candidatus Omnitrophota bacterium]MCM8826200.1 tetratricopeptide repeat protein [Candidatus Omnitrophota bacterium]
MYKKIILIIFFLLPFSLFATSQKELANIYSRYLKAGMYIQQDKIIEALRELKEIKKLDPKSSHIHLKIALLMVKLGDFDNAEKEFKMVKKISPNNLEASLGLIFLYSYLDRKVELENEYGEFLEKAHNVRPEDMRISEYLGQFYFYKKRLDDAIRIYEAVIKAKPDYFDAKYLLGYFYEEKGDRQKAIQIWKEILEKNPLHPDTLNSLGYVYAEEGINLDEAEALIKKSLENAPNNPAYLDSLGWVYFKKGDYIKAEEYLKKAIESTSDPLIYEHVGDLYIKLNDKEKALYYYHKGLEIEPDNSRLKERIDRYGREDRGIEDKSKTDSPINH